MEGIPRMPMLAPEMRVPDRPLPEGFAEKLREYILINYQDDPSKYESAFKEVESMRLTAMRCSADVESVCVLKRYYAQLLMIKKRFPMEPGDSCAVPFSWADKALDLPTSLVYEDINFELCCILFNIAAAHANIAERETRSDMDSIKNGFMHWQWAAWPIQQLRDSMGCTRYAALEFDSSFLTFFLNVFLAQVKWLAYTFRDMHPFIHSQQVKAQECMLEKSMIDHRKPTVIAKIAVQLHETYGQCVLHLNNSGLADLASASKFKEWVRVCTTKYELYGAISNFYLGHEAEEEKKMGERLGYFARALEQITSACKIASKHRQESLKQGAQFAYDVIFQREANARKENGFIYHEKVPKTEEMRKVEGVSMVKPISFDPCNSSVGGEDLFKELLPTDVIRTLSLYSEEKSSFKRSLFERIEKKDEELERYLLSLHLDQIHLDEPVNQTRLPDELLQASAAFSSQPEAFPDLLEKLHNMTGKTGEAGKKLDDLRRRLQAIGDNELAKDDGFKAIKAKLSELTDHHQRARANNEELQRALAAHSENLKLLAMPLGELSRRICGEFINAADTAEGTQLRKMLDKVDEMRRQRCQLADTLKEDLDCDDISKRALAERELDPKKLFEAELRKHQPTVALVEQNMTAQDKILDALTEANANFAELRQKILNANERKTMESLTLVTAFQVFSDVVQKTDQALAFYKQLATLVSALSKGVEHIEDTKAKERREAERIAKEKEAKKACNETMDEFRFFTAPCAGDGGKPASNIPTPTATAKPTAAPRYFPPNPAPVSSNVPVATVAGNRPRLADYIGRYKGDGKVGAPPTTAMVSSDRNFGGAPLPPYLPPPHTNLAGMAQNMPAMPASSTHQAPSFPVAQTAAMFTNYTTPMIAAGAQFPQGSQQVGQQLVSGIMPMFYPTVASQNGRPGGPAMNNSAAATIGYASPSNPSVSIAQTHFTPHNIIAAGATLPSATEPTNVVPTANVAFQNLPAAVNAQSPAPLPAQTAPSFPELVVPQNSSSEIAASPWHRNLSTTNPYYNPPTTSAISYFGSNTGGAK